MSVLDQPIRFSSDQVCELAGITYRQLDYWVRLRYLRPRNARYGSGHGRVWTTQEALKAVAIARMLEAGIVLNKAAELAQAGLRGHLVTEPIPEGEPT